MKRTERHHLKENELVNLAARTREAIDARQREVGAIAITGVKMKKGQLIVRYALE